MKKIVFFLFTLLFVSCGTIKPTQKKSNSALKEHVLPPNTASNKYSKMRQTQLD